MKEHYESEQNKSKLDETNLKVLEKQLGLISKDGEKPKHSKISENDDSDSDSDSDSQETEEEQQVSEIIKRDPKKHSEEDREVLIEKVTDECLSIGTSDFNKRIVKSILKKGGVNAGTRKKKKVLKIL